MTAGTGCPACGGACLSQTDKANPFHPLLHCNGCGHEFVPAEQLGAGENVETQLEFFDEAFAGRAGFFVDLYEGINTRRTLRALELAPRSRVLEIGPGSGAVMSALAAQGHDVCGLDLSPSVARQIEQRRGLPVRVQSLTDHLQSDGGGRYDAVIMRHVLEHFADVSGAVHAVYMLLKNDGKLYIAVPNMHSWHAGFAGWTGYEPYHVHYFNESSLRGLLGRAGFHIRDMKSFESLSGWPNTLLQTLKGRGAPGGRVPAPQGDWKRAALETLRVFAGVVISPLRWLQGYWGKGEELVVVAGKIRA